MFICGGGRARWINIANASQTKQARYSKCNLTLYAKGCPLSSYVPLFLKYALEQSLPLGIDLIPGQTIREMSSRAGMRTDGVAVISQTAHGRSVAAAAAA